MADAYIVKTEVAKEIPSIIAQEAQLYLKDKLYMAKLVTRDYSKDLAKKGETVSVPIYPSFAVVDAPGDGTSFETQDGTITDVTITLDKHKIIPFAITDLALLKSNEQVMQRFLNQTFGPLVEQIEDDILALTSTFTQSLAASTVCTVLLADDSTYIAQNELTKIRRQLNDSKVPRDQRYLLMSNHDEMFQLRNDKFIEASFVADQGKAIKEAYLGTRYGLNMLSSNRIPYTDEAGPPTFHQYKNLAFHPEAIGLVTRPIKLGTEPPGVLVKYITDSDSQIVFRVMISYNHAKLTWIVSTDVLYGVKILRDTFGYVVTSTEDYA